MKKRITALLAGLLLALSIAQPTAANTGDYVNIATSDNFTGAYCLQIAGDRQSLTNVNGCGNWDNRINSLRVNIPDAAIDGCFRFFTGQGYTGTVVLTVYGPASLNSLYNFSSAYDNTISSWYNGHTTRLSSGALNCAE